MADAGEYDPLRAEANRRLELINRERKDAADKRFAAALALLGEAARKVERDSKQEEEAVVLLAQTGSNSISSSGRGSSS